MHQQWTKAYTQDKYGDITTRQFLRDAVLTREMVDRFLDPDALNFTMFDSELGYAPRDYVMHDGIDGSYTINRFLPSGQRRPLNFVGLPCRINTYGNSFTQCNRVSDGESWQEYLAAHFGEPIRNFGVGGYGVYQAYRRMLRMEKTKSNRRVSNPQHLVGRPFQEYLQMEVASQVRIPVCPHPSR